MIAAILTSRIPVTITDAHSGGAVVTALGRDNLDNHYVGGEGYVPTKTTFVTPDALAAVAVIDEENCDKLQSWIAAMEDTDFLASDESPATGAALEIEANAYYAFVDYIRTHSLPRQNGKTEITPLSTPAIPEFVFGEGDYAENLHRSGLALQSQGRP